MKNKRNKNAILYMYICVILAVVISLYLGRYTISIAEIFQVIFRNSQAKLDNSVASNIILNVRLPRIIAAVFLGGALSVAGASYQGIFKNPMVSPSLLGVSSGAGFGAALGIIFHMKAGGIQGMAFAFGLFAVGIAYLVSQLISKKMDRTLTLILIGIVISSLFTSLLALLKYVGDPYSDLPAITFWLLGSLADVNMKDIYIISIPVIIGISALMALRWKINIMTLDEDEAMSLGIETKKIRSVIVLCATIITAAVVSVSGMISWVGLVIPHIARMIVGSDYKKLLPASLALGAIFMLMLDDISRVLLVAEIPLGILTSLLGTPFFLFLMIKGKRSW